MIMSHLRVENFKGLREIDVPLSRFACLIGENNAGKSSVCRRCHCSLRNRFA